jgi:hypothetical protein
VDVARDDGTSDLAQLRKEERSVSVRRTRLHARIDFLRAGGYAGESGDTLEELERQEQELSRQRRDLHERIERATVELAARSDGAA